MSMIEESHLKVFLEFAAFKSTAGDTEFKNQFVKTSYQ